MERLNNNTRNSSFTDSSSSMLLPAAGIFVFVLFSAFALAILTSESSNPFKDMYLMPWVLATGIVIAAPTVYLFYKGKFNFFHPLTFAAWTYFFPAFAVGGLILASGLSQPYYLIFVDDQTYNLPLTLSFVMIGYAGLSAGFFFPYAKRIGGKISEKLPKWDSTSDKLLIPGLLLLATGLINTIFAFVNGLIGFQRVDQIGQYDGLLFLLTLFWLEASFLLWLCVFRAKSININHLIVIGILIFTALTKSAFQGNRGSLISVFIMIAFAFVASGRKINVKHRVFASITIVLALIVGMVYGTTFRNLKQTEAQIGMDEYAGYIGQTFDKVTEQDMGKTLSKGFEALAERVEAVSALAVVVSNYEKLKPYEESYGLDNNIYKDTVTFFIPRAIWEDKPVASEPRKYGELYFHYGENSFTITPMGDLLRNFGPIGVPIGMLLLGFGIRIMYSALIEDQEFSYWRVTLFYMLLTAISFESFYGSILPYVVKVGVISVLGILFIRFFAGKARKLLYNE